MKEERKRSSSALFVYTAKPNTVTLQMDYLPRVVWPKGAVNWAKPSCRGMLGTEKGKG